MENSKPQNLPSLEEVLVRINFAGDFMFKPAVTASDKSESNDSPLHKAAIWGDVQAAEVLLAHGADINAAGEYDDTPLHRAKGNEMARFLLSRGADPDRKNVFGWSCRADLEKSGDPEIIAALRARKR